MVIKIRHIVYLIFGACVVIGVIRILPGKLFYKPEVPEAKIEYYVTTEVDTVQLRLEIKAELLAELKPQIRVKEKIITEKVNVDSLFDEAKKQFQAELDKDLGMYNYIADFDTSFTIRDSSNKVTDELAVHGQYVSPIPLHKDSNFRLFFNHKSYTNTVHLHETVIEKIPTKFGFGIQATGGYELTHGKGGFMIGIGVHYQVKELLPFGWFEFLGHGIHVTAGYDPVKKDYGVTVGYGLHIDLFGG